VQGHNGGANDAHCAAVIAMQADVHLVVDVGEQAYLAIDKGPISDTHALVVAVEHYPNIVTLKPEALADVESIIKSLKAAYASRGLELVGFERCAIGSCVPC
jgi:diadenosine tetraphosphate (Ap4A) HIT family hydrolase